MSRGPLLLPGELEELTRALGPAIAALVASDRAELRLRLGHPRTGLEALVVISIDPDTVATFRRQFDSEPGDLS